MHILGAFMTAAACLGLGLACVQTKKLRIETLGGLCTALELVRAELETRLMSLPELCSYLFKHLSGPAADFIRELGKSMELLGEREFSALWQSAAENNLKGLTEAELDEMKNIGTVLGRCELSEQTSALSAGLDFLRTGLEEARAAYPAERRLGIGVGLSSAALLILGLM